MKTMRPCCRDVHSDLEEELKAQLGLAGSRLSGDLFFDQLQTPPEVLFEGRG